MIPVPVVVGCHVRRAGDCIPFCGVTAPGNLLIDPHNLISRWLRQRSAEHIRKQAEGQRPFHIPPLRQDLWVNAPTLRNKYKIMRSSSHRNHLYSFNRNPPYPPLQEKGASLVSSRPSQALKEWMEKQVSSARPGQSIPPDRALAEKFGISVRTVERLLSEYRDRGQIVRIPGKGTFVGQEEPEPEGPIEHPRSSADMLAETIVREISSGNYRVGEALPSNKFMCLQFGVAPVTVHKAYRRLEQMGLVTRIGKTVWVGSDLKTLVRTRPKREVYLVNYRSNDFSNVFRKDPLAAVYQKMERALFASGYMFRFMNSEDLDDACREWVHAKALPSGLVFFCTDQDQVEQIRATVHYLTRLRDMPSPRILVDLNTADYRTLPRQVMVFSRGTRITMATRALLHYLIEKQYATVNIYIDESRDLWSNYALMLLAKMKAESGAIHAPVKIHYVVKPIREGATPEQLLNIQGWAKHYFTRLLNKYGDIPLTSIYSDISIARDDSSLIARHGKADMWVCATADAAAAVFDEARKAGLAVPRDVAVLSLEDDPRYYHLGISYCGPDHDQLGYLLAHALIGDIPIAKTSKGYIRTSGMVIEKLTS
ncbi:MAG: GntR family transcriptional regulator [Chitinivibrionales bacterium]|nr:GntR family transcriptional regulator [Chitinivibrionales bacterium]MBD3396171.1 GntR family transcriptional regulator [Chitinivibrionales bacterium]